VKRGKSRHCCKFSHPSLLVSGMPKNKKKGGDRWRCAGVKFLKENRKRRGLVKGYTRATMSSVKGEEKNRVGGEKSQKKEPVLGDGERASS